MGLTKAQQEQIEKMTQKYTERLAKKAADGKELSSAHGGRIPSDVAEENVEAYKDLREQLVTLKKLRQESVGKLRELKEQIEELRGPRKPRKKSAKKSSK
jgi:hypothetical protein